MPHPVFSGPASGDYCSPGDRFPYAPRVLMFPKFSTRVSSRAQRLVQHKHRIAWKGHRFIIHGGNTQPVKARDSIPFLKGQLCSRIKPLFPTMVIGPLISSVDLIPILFDLSHSLMHALGISTQISYLGPSLFLKDCFWGNPI